MELLEKKIFAAIQDGAFPGMEYGIIKDGQVETGAVGYMRELGPNISPNAEKITEDTRYDIASLSKVVVTVTVVSKLIARGVIHPEDKIKKYLPRFKYDDITIADLLTHTSGLAADLDGKEFTTKEDTLDKLYSKERVMGRGEKVVYSDLGFMFLGEMLESIYGKSLEEIAKEEVFEPLNMISTCYNPTNREICAPTEDVFGKRPLVQGIVHDEKACSMNGAAGNAGVFTTAKDLTNFVMMILNDGIFNGQQFLPKEIIDLWFTPFINDVDGNRTRSYCWIVGHNRLVSERDGQIISFTGFTGPSIMIDRENGLGIVLLANRTFPSRDNKKLTAARPVLTEAVYKELGLAPNEI